MPFDIQTLLFTCRLVSSNQALNKGYNERKESVIVLYMEACVCIYVGPMGKIKINVELYGIFGNMVYKLV